MSLRTVPILSLVALAAFAQSPTFEVASIRPSGAESIRGSDGGPGHSDPTRFTFGRASLLDLIGRAYDVKTFQVVSRVPLPDQAFDLIAQVPAGATKEQFRLMLQNFLAERFAFKAHIESREFPAYELVVAKGGPKLQEAIPAEPSPRPGGPGSSEGWPALRPNQPGMASGMSNSGGYQLVRLVAQEQTMSALAGFIPAPGNLPVVDKTGLTGKYNFRFEYTTEPQGAVPDAPPLVPDVSTALPRQLGLQLVSKKLPFDVVVVDSFNKLPTDN